MVIMSEQMPDQLPATDWSSRSLRLNCVGAGLVGKTLCHLMARHIQLNQVINQSQSSAQQAVDFIGAGRPFGIGSKPLTHLEPADIWMITCPDDLIESVGNKIIQSGRLQPGNIIFHCSGAISSKIFQIPKLADISVASVHPIHSFSDPRSSLESFSGTPCAIEGDPKATKVLDDLFQSIGADLFSINSESKSLYHASTVMACNYLVSLLELSKMMLSQAGVDHKNHSNPLKGLIEQTLGNYLTGDAQTALTGPISRGDVDTIASHLTALENAPSNWRKVYCSLGNIAADISSKQSLASPQSLQAITKLLNQKDADRKYD